MAEEIRLHITAIMNKIFSLIKLLQNKIWRKIKEFGELDLKCELKIKIKPGHIPVSKAKATLSRGRLARTLLPLLAILVLCRNHF